MFDIAFSELLFVAFIALIVLGPERLPAALATLGLWIGRARHTVNNIKATIEQEIGADDIKQQLTDEAILKEMKRLEKGLVIAGQIDKENQYENSEINTNLEGKSNSTA